MYFVFFGLIILHNPIYIYYLMSHGGLGGITISFALRILYFTIIIFYSLFQVINNKKIFLPRNDFILIGLFTAIVLVNSIFGVIRYNSIQYFTMDFVPIFEFILFYFVGSISIINKKILSFRKTINYLFLYLGSAGLLNVILYVFASRSLLSDFGALKALVGGVTVNRLMDFIIPLFFPLTLIVSFKGIKKYFHYFLISILSVLIILTFFRTVYLAVIIGILVILITSGLIKSKIFSNLFKVSIIAFPIMILSNSVFTNLFNLGFELNFGDIFYERLLSIFEFSDTSTTFSKYSRLDQYNDLDKIFTYFPLGHGLGAFIGSDPASIMSNYFVSLFILIGLPGGLIFVLMIFKALKKYYFINRFEATNEGMVMFSASALSILSMIIIIFIFFPYVKYFPIMMILGYLVGLSSILNKRVKFTNE